MKINHYSYKKLSVNDIQTDFYNFQEDASVNKILTQSINLSPKSNIIFSENLNLNLGATESFYYPPLINSPNISFSKTWKYLYNIQNHSDKHKLAQPWENSRQYYFSSSQQQTLKQKFVSNTGQSIKLSLNQSGWLKPIIKTQ